MNNLLTKHMGSGNKYIAFVIALANMTIAQAQNLNAADSTQKIKQQKLDSVVVTANRPLLKVGEDGAMLYDAKLLAKNRPVANAYDLLDEIPGVEKVNDVARILGTNKTTVILNGRRSQMSNSEMANYLATLSPDQVKRIEVYYDAPPQYGVRGGMINIVLQQRRSEKLLCNGTAWTALYQGRKYFQTEGLTLRFYKKKWMWETGYSMGYMNTIKSTSLVSHHTVDDKLTEITNDTKRYADAKAKKVTTLFNYDFSKTSNLEVSYLYRWDSPDYTSRSPLWENGELISSANTDFRNPKHSHIWQAKYTNKNLNIGGNFVFFKNRYSQTMIAEEKGALSLEAAAFQKVRQGEVYLNNTQKIGKGQLRYGIDYYKSVTDNAYSNHWINTWRNDANEDKTNRQTEQCHTAYVGWTQTLKKVNFSAYLEASYYHAEMEKEGTETNMGYTDMEKDNDNKNYLWKEWTFAPSLSLTYKIDKLHSLIFSCSTDRTYPAFAKTSGRRSYINEYIVLSNDLRVNPYTSYSFHLNYVIRNRYIVGLYSTIVPHEIIQQMYQNPNEYLAKYQFFNLERNNKHGFMVVIPYNWSGRFNSKLTSYTSLYQTKGTFYDLTFDRNKLAEMVTLTNNAILGKKKNIILQLNGTYNTKRINGYSDIYSARFNSTLALSWNLSQKGWSIVAKATDLLGTAIERSEVNYKNQHYKYKSDKDIRKVIVTIRYTFNGYKQKALKEVDTSRMGW